MNGAQDTTVRSVHRNLLRMSQTHINYLEASENFTLMLTHAAEQLTNCFIVIIVAKAKIFDHGKLEGSVLK